MLRSYKREFDTRQLIYLSCKELAESKDNSNFEYFTDIINSMILARHISNLPPYSFTYDIDYSNYILSIQKANVEVIKFFNEKGLNPFDPTSLLHFKLYQGNDSISNELEALRKLQSSSLEKTKEYTNRAEMIHWLESQFGVLKQNIPKAQK